MKKTLNIGIMIALFPIAPIESMEHEEGDYLIPLLEEDRYTDKLNTALETIAQNYYQEKINKITLRQQVEKAYLDIWVPGFLEENTGRSDLIKTSPFVVNGTKSKAKEHAKNEVASIDNWLKKKNERCSFYLKQFYKRTLTLEEFKKKAHETFKVAALEKLDYNKAPFEVTTTEIQKAKAKKQAAKDADKWLEEYDPDYVPPKKSCWSWLCCK